MQYQEERRKPIEFYDADKVEQLLRDMDDKEERDHIIDLSSIKNEVLPEMKINIFQDLHVNIIIEN